MYKPILLIDDRHSHSQGAGKEFYDSLNDRLKHLLIYWDNLDDKVIINDGNFQLKFSIDDYSLILMHHNYKSFLIGRRERSRLIRLLGDKRILFAGDGAINDASRRISRGHLYRTLEFVLSFYLSTGLMNDVALINPSQRLHLPLIEKLETQLEIGKKELLESREFKTWIINAGFDYDKVKDNYMTKSISEIQQKIEGWKTKEIIWKL